MVTPPAESHSRLCSVTLQSALLSWPPSDASPLSHPVVGPQSYSCPQGGGSCGQMPGDSERRVAPTTCPHPIYQETASPGHAGSSLSAGPLFSGPFSSQQSRNVFFKQSQPHIRHICFTSCLLRHLNALSLTGLFHCVPFISMPFSVSFDG